MRVISGQARGLKLKAPEGLETRPTTDRIKESLFNIMAPDLYGCVFLDLFSGSGGIGIEALSRGAEKAVFVDSSPKSIAVIKDNLSRARLEDKAEVICKDIFSVIKSLSLKGAAFDIIYMDPPYSKGLVDASIEAIHSGGILKKDGYIAAEQATDEPPLNPSGFKVFRVKDYKRTTKITFLGYADEENS